jgi:hypothetical protein
MDFRFQSHSCNFSWTIAMFDNRKFGMAHFYDLYQIILQISLPSNFIYIHRIVLVHDEHYFEIYLRKKGGIIAPTEKTLTRIRILAHSKSPQNIIYFERLICHFLKDCIGHLSILRTSHTFHCSKVCFNHL